MSSILQAQQLYTTGIPLLEAYLLPMANNWNRHNECLSAASHVVQIYTHARFLRSKTTATKWRFEVTMPLCPGCPCPGWIDSRFCLRGKFRREDTFLEQLTVTGGTQQSGPSKIGLEATFGSARHTHVAWFGWNAPVAGTNLPGYPPFNKEKNITGKLSARSRVCE